MNSQSIKCDSRNGIGSSSAPCKKRFSLQLIQKRSARNEETESEDTARTLSRETKRPRVSFGKVQVIEEKSDLSTPADKDPSLVEVCQTKLTNSKAIDGVLDALRGGGEWERSHVDAESRFRKLKESTRHLAESMSASIESAVHLGQRIDEFMTVQSEHMVVLSPKLIENLQNNYVSTITACGLTNTDAMQLPEVSRAYEESFMVQFNHSSGLPPCRNNNMCMGAVEARRRGVREKVLFPAFLFPDERQAAREGKLCNILRDCVLCNRANTARWVATYAALGVRSLMVAQRYRVKVDVPGEYSSAVVYGMHDPGPACGIVAPFVRLESDLIDLVRDSNTGMYRFVHTDNALFRHPPATPPSLSRGNVSQ